MNEPQFLNPKQIGQLYRIAKTDEVSVIVYGLKFDFQGNVFPGS